MQQAGIVSRLTWSWLTPLLALGKKRVIDLPDLPRLPDVDHARSLTDRLGERWAAEQRASGGPRKHAFFKALCKTFGKAYSWMVLSIVAESLVRLLQVLFVIELVGWFSAKAARHADATTAKGFLLAAGLVACLFSHGTLHHVYFFGANRIGAQMRMASQGLMFRKAMSVRAGSLSTLSAGKVLSVLSNDLTKFEESASFLAFLVAAPLETIGALVVLWREIGASCLIGFVVLAVFMPWNGISSRIVGKRRAITAAHTDSRLKILGDVLAGMRVTKLYAWEGPFGERIRSERQDEIGSMRVFSRFLGINISMPLLLSILTAFLTFVLYVGLGNALTPRAAFATLGIFQFLQLTVTFFAPIAVMFTSEALVTAHRVQEFLLLGDASRDAESREAALDAVLSKSAAKSAVSAGGGGALSDDPSAPLALVENAEFSWSVAPTGAVADTAATSTPGKRASPASIDPASPNSGSADPKAKSEMAAASAASEAFRLRKIDFALRGGQVLAVIGAVGSGKSSLLHALLDEMTTLAGTSRVCSSVGYAAQEPWIVAGTLRENVLFGLEYDAAWFGRVVQACALVRDLAALPHGDLTVIGERGVTLSGGQRARVALARALYARPRLLLLDDPLSAVDPAVGRHLFSQAIRDLMATELGAAVVLVTHQLQYCSDADTVVLLDDGLQCGPPASFDEITKRCGSSSSLLSLYAEQEAQADAHAAESGGGADADAHADEAAAKKKRDDGGADQTYEAGTAGDSAVAEQRETGTVALKLFVTYFRQMGPLRVTLPLLGLIALTQAVLVLPMWWLARWSSASPANQRRPFWIGIYVLISFVAIIMAFVRVQLWFRYALDAAQVLHDRMTSAVLRSPMRFFDENPVGRILNRFAQDQGQIDTALPWIFMDFLQVSLGSLVAVLIAIIVVPWIAIPLVPLCFLFIYYRQVFVRSSREVKRLDALSRSPVFASFAASLHGLLTIRAFAASPRFFATFLDLLDDNMAAYITFLGINRWLGFRLDMISSSYVTFFTFVAVGTSGAIDASLIGYALVLLLSLVGSFQWSVRQSTVLENIMTAVQRVDAYAQLPSEAPAELASDSDLPADWPSRGAIELRGLSMRYKDSLPLAVRDVSFSVPPGAKVGIVGATGSGKSSLLAALFRLVEPTQPGAVSIDGVATSSVGLTRLRSALAVVPQEPVLFSGTVRRNLDPFGLYSDDEIWRALEAVELADAIRSLAAEAVPPLQHPADVVLAERGSNLSVGSKQLLCAARAMLRRARILVLDEASANIDLDSDAKLQRLIRARFDGCTVLTIAHRLHTIIDYDLILVLGGGGVLEYGPTRELLRKPGGAFAAMVAETGARNARALYALAGLAPAADGGGDGGDGGERSTSEIAQDDMLTGSFSYEYEVSRDTRTTALSYSYEYDVSLSS